MAPSYPKPRFCCLLLATQNWLTEEELNRVVAQYDINKDGVIK